MISVRAESHFRRALPFVAAGVLSLLIAGVLLSRLTRRHDIDFLREQVGREAALLARQVELLAAGQDTTVNWPKLAVQWRDDLATHVSFFDSAGIPLTDPDNPDLMAGSPDALRDLPEVRDALDAGQGWNIRQPSESRFDILYVAYQSEHDGRVGVIVRLAVSLDTLSGQQAAIRRLFLWLLGGTVVVVTALSAWLSASSHRELTRLATAAARISQGDLDTRIAIDPYRRSNAFSAVAHAFNRMAGEVKSRFAESRHERDQLQTVIANMNDGLLAVDGHGVVRHVNQTFLRYFRSVFDEPVGHHHTETFRDQSLNEQIEKMLAGSSGEEGELTTLSPGRRILVVRMAVIPDAGGNEVRGVLLARDVTARRRIQEMRRDFVANVSHELRTPLTSVLGYLEALRDRLPTDPQTAEFLDTIGRNAGRMNSIVGDLLELSRIESSGFQLNLTSFSLRALAEEVSLSVSTMLCAEHQTLTIAIDASADAITADRNAVLRILTNLVDNAHKYTPDGGQITIAAQRAADEVVLTVSDDGIGVPESDRPRLFERFFRVDRARSRDSGGTGLGLAIVKHLAEAHGGSARYEPVIPQGSRLIIVLPQPVAESASAGA